MRVFGSAEEASKFVKTTPIAGPSFELAIADGFTFAGSPDTIGAGMAIVLDAILGQGYGPDGFEHRDGYRLYRYRPLES